MDKVEMNCIADRAARYLLILQKEYLSVSEAAIYLDVTQSYIKSLIHPSKGAPPLIPVYSGGGYLTSVKRSDLDAYRTRIRLSSQDELDSEAVLAQTSKTGRI